jgi:hypothetical protein
LFDAIDPSLHSRRLNHVGLERPSHELETKASCAIYTMPCSESKRRSGHQRKHLWSYIWSIPEFLSFMSYVAGQLHWVDRRRSSSRTFHHVSRSGYTILRCIFHSRTDRTFYISFILIPDIETGYMLEHYLDQTLTKISTCQGIINPRPFLFLRIRATFSKAASIFGQLNHQIDSSSQCSLPQKSTGSSGFSMPWPFSCQIQSQICFVVDRLTELGQEESAKRSWGNGCTGLIVSDRKIATEISIKANICCVCVISPLFALVLEIYVDFPSGNANWCCYPGTGSRSSTKIKGEIQENRWPNIFSICSESCPVWEMFIRIWLSSVMLADTTDWPDAETNFN